MKLYFGVTTFKWFNISPGRVISWAHRMSGYFPYNSGHAIEIIFWGYHIQVVNISPGRVVSWAHYI